jgi:hypothetical protein
MKRVLSVLGYVWAAAALPVVLFTFLGMNTWAGKLAGATGVVISPWYTGGEVARTTDHGAWRMQIHRPVFDGLFGQRKTGFVQVDFVGAGGIRRGGTGAAGAAPDSAGALVAALPASIDEDIDFDADGRADFHLALTTASCATVVTPLSPRVLGLREAFRLDDGVGVRVELKNSR